MKNRFPYLVILILAIMLLATLRECGKRSGHEAHNRTAIADTVKYYRNRLGTITASKATLQLDKSRLQDMIIEKDADIALLLKEFRQVKYVLRANATLRADSIPIMYTERIPYDFERSDKIINKWYQLGYASNQEGIRIDSLYIPLSMTAITGVKRKWLLGKETVTTDITFDNPYISVTDMQAAEVVLRTPWYKKWYVWAAIGAAGGFCAAK